MRADHRIEGDDEDQIGGRRFGDRGKEHEIGERARDRRDDAGSAADIGNAAAPAALENHPQDGHGQEEEEPAGEHQGPFVGRRQPDQRHIEGKKHAPTAVR